MTTHRPEFSRRIPVSRIGTNGIEHRIEASAAECQALAERLQLPAVASFTSIFRLAAPVRGQIAADAELRAEITQICVVSLEAFEATVSERFTLRFVPEGAEEAEIDPASTDEFGYAGDSIDIGEAASEQLALALDPYPRMPGVVLPHEAEMTMASSAAVDPDAPAGLRKAAPEGVPGGTPEEEARPPHPFAALARLRGGSGSGHA